MLVIDRVKYVYVAANGRYKYARDVPQRLRRLLGKNRWDYSLGSNYTKATEKAADYRREHDALIASLASPEALIAAHETEANEEIGRLLTLQTILSSSPIASLEFRDTINVNADVWRRTPDMMEKVRLDTPAKEWERDNVKSYFVHIGCLSNLNDIQAQHIRLSRRSGTFIASLVRWPTVLSFDMGDVFGGSGRSLSHS